MSDDMEIMKEFKEIVSQKDPKDEQEIYRIIGKLALWLPDAVKREIVGAFEKASTTWVGSPAWNELIAKYSPPPRYCAGMQEAVGRNLVKIIDGSIWVLDDNLKPAMEINKVCPFCKEGKNCIGGKE